MTRSFPVATSLSEVYTKSMPKGEGSAKQLPRVLTHRCPAAPATPPVHSPTRGGVENATLEVAHVAYQQAFLIDRETWLHAAVCRRVTVCRGRPRHGCRLSLALHTSQVSPYTAIWREDTTCPRALPRSLRDVDQRDRTRALYLGHLVLSRHLLCTW